MEYGPPHPLFRDRQEAGRRLAERLIAYRRADPLVLGLPRGGVVVAAQVARALEAPLDIIVARKLGVPSNPEFGVGAIAPDVLWVDEASLERAGVERPDLEPVIQAERAEMERRLALYRGHVSLPHVRDRVVILVDDGIATGVTARAAVRALRKAQARMVVLAAPLAPRETVEALESEFDEVVVLRTPAPFHAVGAWYESFEATSDHEVTTLLAQSHMPPEGDAGPVAT